MAEGIGVASAFTENTASGYARVPVAFTALNQGGANLAQAITVPATSSYVVTQRALYDAATGGNLIMWWNLKNPVSVSSGTPDKVNVGAFKHFFPALYTNGGAGVGSTPVEFAAGSQIGSTDTGYPLYAGVALEAKNSAIYAAANTTAQPAATVSRLTGSGSIPATASPMEVSIRQTAAGTYTLPSAPADGFQVTIKDAGKNFATYNATIQPGSGDTLEGASNYVMNGNGESFWLTYDATNKNWDIG